VADFFIFFSLVLKAGIAPGHFWFPQVANNLKWIQCLIIFTWQKIAPLLLLVSFSAKNIFTVASLSAFVGALGGFNQNVLKLILTYSSISHRGWIVIRCLIRLRAWRFYFFVYCFLSLAIVIFFYSNQTKKIRQIFINKDSYLNKIILSVNIISLGGLPPLLGFTAKLNIILLLLRFNSLLVLAPLIIRSLISLFFYTRIIYSNIININKKIFLSPPHDKKPIFNFYTVSILLNTVSPMLLIFT